MYDMAGNFIWNGQGSSFPASMFSYKCEVVFSSYMFDDMSSTEIDSEGDV